MSGSNEQLWQSLHIDNISSQLLTLKIHSVFNLRNKIIKEIAILLISIFLHGKILHCLILLHIWHMIS